MTGRRRVAKARAGPAPGAEELPAPACHLVPAGHLVRADHLVPAAHRRPVDSGPVAEDRVASDPGPKEVASRGGRPETRVRDGGATPLRTASSGRAATIVHPASILSTAGRRIVSQPRAPEGRIAGASGRRSDAYRPPACRSMPRR